MTIDTSREAVELRQTRLRAAYKEFRAPYGHIAALITQAKLTEKMMDALLAERDAALVDVARLSTPPDDAEVINLTGEAQSMSRFAARPLWQDVSRLIDAMADALTRLSRAHAAERKLADDAVDTVQRMRAYITGPGIDRTKPITRQADDILAAHAAHRKE